MSRTIRRTKALKHYSRFEKNYTWDRLDVWFDVVNENSYFNAGTPRRPLPDPEFTRRKWEYYSDKGCHEFGFENAFERPFKEHEGGFRAKMKCEVVKWLKDHDHEIQFRKRALIWDYC